MIADANGIPATFADLGDYPMPLYNGDLEAAEGQPENARKFKALMQAHSGIFIASPEYNASITPLLEEHARLGEPRARARARSRCRSSRRACLRSARRRRAAWAACAA